MASDPAGEPGIPKTGFVQQANVKHPEKESPLLETKAIFTFHMNHTCVPRDIVASCLLTRGRLGPEVVDDGELLLVDRVEERQRLEELDENASAAATVTPLHLRAAQLRGSVTWVHTWDKHVRHWHRNKCDRVGHSRVLVTFNRHVHHSCEKHVESATQEETRRAKRNALSSQTAQLSNVGLCQVGQPRCAPGWVRRARTR